MKVRARVPVTVLFLAIIVAALPAFAAEKVTIPARTEAGEEMKLPGILHRPSGGGWLFSGAGKMAWSGGSAHVHAKESPTRIRIDWCGRGWTYTMCSLARTA